jgi:paraquat-inducible protein B
MRQVEAALERVEASARDDSPLMYTLQEVLTEVAAASRSMRVLTDYLQNHPEALLRGKKP